MPSKGQKVARRQNQIRNRRRRGPRRASTQKFEQGPTVSKMNLEDVDAVPAPAPATITEPTVTPIRTRRSQQVVEGAGPAAARFLPGELRHIGLVTLVILAILATAAVAIGEVL